jgi:porphobilinogen deaminase
VFRSSVAGKADDAAVLGRRLAEVLLDKGAKKILDEIYAEK